MTKRKSLGEKPRSSSSVQTTTTPHHLPSSAAVRETIESLAFAVVLAFLVRTFEAEAFVIPTGSMAPTLMGRHKDLFCPKCGSPYQVGSSDEVNNDGVPKGPLNETVAGTCPMCRYTADLAPDNPQRLSYPSYSGDRILVSKFAYQLADPERWDIIVFKFPGDQYTDARTNFIKRLAGLPGETIRIQHGDIWARRGEEPFAIRRKPPKKLLAMLQPVFDNDYMAKIGEDGWPARWRSEPAADGSPAGTWTSDDPTKFRTDGAAAGEHWLRYSHLAPSYDQWRRELRRGPDSVTLVPQLITDFTAYNTVRPRGAGDPEPDPESVGRHWVGDLAIACTADVQGAEGGLIIELRKGGRQFQCRIDVATGQATLSISGQDMEAFRPTAATQVRGRGKHDILFSNCDEELRLWVDGSPVRFDAPTVYADLGNTRPDQSDLTPVGVGSAGAAVQISHLRILRDIYYLAIRGEVGRAENRDVEYRSVPALPGEGKVAPGPEHVDFVLGPDQFFALGDNSQRSKDGRLWGTDNYWVPRELLIGKALFIYWPHSWNTIPYVNVPFPYFPNFARMRLVR